MLQSLLPNDRGFDPYDILANVVGSLPGVLLCSWYHKRMLERRRKNKHYDIVPGDDVEEGAEGDPERDVELGTVRDQETGVTSNGQAVPGAQGKTDVTDELDNWDENAEDWDDGDAADVGDSKKRAD